MSACLRVSLCPFDGPARVSRVVRQHFHPAYRHKIANSSGKWAVKAHKVRWSIYGWSLEPQPSGFVKFVGRMTTEPVFAFSVVFGFLVLCLLLKLVAPPPAPQAMKKE